MFLDNIGFLLLCNNFVSSIIQGNDLFRTKTTQYEEREFPLYSIWNPLLRIYMVSSEGSLYLIFSKQLLSSAFSWKIVHFCIRNNVGSVYIEADTSLIPKQPWVIRVYCDFRGLKASTIRDAYPLLRIDEELDALNGSTLFSTFKLVNCVLQFTNAAEEMAKIAFNTSSRRIYE